MHALDQSDALMRRGDTLRAQSMRIRARADEKMAKSRRLIAAAHKAVMRARGEEPTGPRGRATAPSAAPATTNAVCRDRTA